MPDLPPDRTTCLFALMAFGAWGFILGILTIWFING